MAVEGHGRERLTFFYAILLLVIVFLFLAFSPLLEILVLLVVGLLIALLLLLIVNIPGSCWSAIECSTAHHKGRTDAADCAPGLAEHTPLRARPPREPRQDGADKTSRAQQSAAMRGRARARSRTRSHGCCSVAQPTKAHGIRREGLRQLALALARGTC